MSLENAFLSPAGKKRRRFLPSSAKLLAHEHTQPIGRNFKVKGMFFQKPLELTLHVEGETWKQGDPIQGLLTIKNHGSEAVPVSEVKVHLAYGTLKKVHQRAPNSFDILASADLQGVSTIEPNSEAELPWKFETDRNSPITDTTDSLFLVYGRGTELEKLGQLQLMVRPDQVIQDFLDTVITGFRFVVKTQKSNKAALDVKLAPPDSKAFSMLEYMVLGFKFDGDELRVKYTFNLKKMEATAASVDVKKLKKSTQQSFRPDQYRIPSGRFNHEHVETSVREALNEIGSGSLL